MKAHSAIRRAPKLGQNPHRSPKAPTSGATDGDEAFMLIIFAHAQQESVVESVHRVTKNKAF